MPPRRCRRRRTWVLVATLAPVLWASVLDGGQPVNAAPAQRSGYALATSSGAIATFGGAGFLGDATDPPPGSPVVGIAGTLDGRGYWLASADGGVRAFGDARAPASPRVGSAAVAVAADPVGPGFWTVDAAGRVSAAAGARRLETPARESDDHSAVAALAPTPSGSGAWLAHVDGSVTSVGSVPNVSVPSVSVPDGSTSDGSDPPRSAPGGPNVVALAATPDGRGYWMARADGTVVTTGDAVFLGSWPTSLGTARVVGLVASADGRGYLMVTNDGAVGAFGDARAAGDGRSPLHPPAYPAAFAPTPVRTVGIALLAPGPQQARHGPARITVLGDSLSVQVAKATGAYLRASRLDARVADGGILGCGVVGGLTLATYAGRGPPVPTLPACAQWRQQDRQAIAFSHPDVVAILLGYWEAQRHGLGGATVSLTSSAGYRSYVVKRLGAVVALARAAGAQVVLIDPPLFADGTPAANVEVFDTLVHAVADRTGSSLFDLGRILDPADHYDATVHGLVVRTPDGVHLTAAGIERLVDPELVPRLLRAASAGRAR